MALLVAGIGVVVLVYSSDYFGGDRGSETVPCASPGTSRCSPGAMLGLVVADDLWTLFVFWELTSVMSFLLIGLDDRVPARGSPAQQALLVTVAGGLAMFGGFVCLTAAGRHREPAGRARAVIRRRRRSRSALALVLVGAFAEVGAVPVPLLAARGRWSRRRR